MSNPEDDLSYPDICEATETITIDGDDAIVHHAHYSEVSAQELADAFYEVAQNHTPEDRDEASFPGAVNHFSEMVDRLPELGQRVEPYTRTDFAFKFREKDVFSNDIHHAIENAYQMFDYDEDTWEHAIVESETPTDADVFAAFTSLVGANWCIHALETRVSEEQEPDQPTKLFSEDFFDEQVTQGLMLAFRDAFIYNAPTSPVQGIRYGDREEGVRDAISNALGIALTDAELQGLLLADWNKSSRLESASDYGKQKTVEQGMKAIENMTEALRNDMGDTEA